MSGSGFTRVFRPAEGLMRRVHTTDQFLEVAEGDTILVYPPCGAFDENQILEVLTDYHDYERVVKVVYQIGDDRTREIYLDRRHGHKYVPVPRRGRVSQGGVKPLRITIFRELELYDPKTDLIKHESVPPTEHLYYLKWMWPDD
jgi:hypothetical protein